jgi:RNA polymerase sigma factor (sigma-70 family)
VSNSRMERVSIDPDINPGVDITYTIKAHHADLWRAAKKMGSVRALADHLGIHYTTLHSWCRLASCPGIGSTKGRSRWRDPVWVAEIERKLFVLTGKTLDDLFPATLRENRAFLAANKTAEITQTMSTRQLAKHAGVSQLPGPADTLVRNEAATALRELVSQLSAKEAEILSLRFGLVDGRSYSLDEVSHKYNITRERVRQIEYLACSRLQRKVLANPTLRESLAALLPWLENVRIEHGMICRE